MHPTHANPLPVGSIPIARVKGRHELSLIFDRERILKSIEIPVLIAGTYHEF